MPSLTRRLTRLYVRTGFRGLQAALGLVRAGHSLGLSLREQLTSRPSRSPVLPDRYAVHNTRTRDGELQLDVQGTLPKDLLGSLFIAQCLGSETSFMVGDTNLVRIDFEKNSARMLNRRMDTPATLAKDRLAGTRFEFGFFGYVYWSFSLGVTSYTEGLWRMPDGRIAVTSDIDRPWLVDPRTLEPQTPMGKRSEWLSFAPEPAATMIGRLFPMINTSQGLFVDHETEEVITADFRMRQADRDHPVRLLRFSGNGPLEAFELLDERGAALEIVQTIHEIVGTRDYIILCDTGFATGNDIFFPWLPLPSPKPETVVHVIARADLKRGEGRVRVKSVRVNLPAIHVFADYENPAGKITLYLLHTPFTNVADVIRADDVDLEGTPFPKHAVGYGTLPPLDVSALGKHVIDAEGGTVVSSTYLRDRKRTFAPYMFTLPNRQAQQFDGETAFVMFRGFDKRLLPSRVHAAFAAQSDRDVPLHELVGEHAQPVLPSLCRIDTRTLRIADCYELPPRTLCFTLCHLPSKSLSSKKAGSAGYLIAAVVTDEPAHAERSSGHEYWLFDAGALAKGPLAKLMHPELHNGTLFHPVFVPGGVDSLRAARSEQPYFVPIREDFPYDEIQLWPELVQSVFRELIYPRYEQRADRAKANRRAGGPTTSTSSEP